MSTIKSVDEKAIERLALLGYDYNSQTRIIREKLLAIEIMADTIKEKRAELIKELKSTTLTKQAIANNLGVTRQALYKDELVADFVNSVLDDKLPEDQLYTTKKKLMKRIEELSERVRQFEVRDVEQEEKRIADERIINLYGDLINKE